MLRSSYLVQCSNTHIHLCQEHLDELLGSKYPYKKVQDLVIKGEWVSNLEVNIFSTYGTLIKERVKVLGSDVTREYSQIETDYGEATYLFKDRDILLADTLPNEPPQYYIEYKDRSVLVGVFIPTDHIHIDNNMRGALELKDGKSCVIYLDGSVQYMPTKFNDLNYNVLKNQRIIGLIHKTKSSYYSFPPNVDPA